MKVLLILCICSYAAALTPTEISHRICDLVNDVRRRYNRTTFFEYSPAMQYVAEIHNENLASVQFDPFLSETCNGHSWFKNDSLGITDCCYPLENCMGQRAKNLTKNWNKPYVGWSIENWHAQLDTRGFTVTPESAVMGWETSPGHLYWMLSDQISCGANIGGIYVKPYYIGYAGLWMGNMHDPNTDTPYPIYQPTIQPSNMPTGYPTPVPSQNPTQKPTIYPTPVPSQNPTPQPSMVPTPVPSRQPTSYPTQVPSQNPTHHPTSYPTPVPSQNPTHHPTSYPTQVPSQNPTPQPSMVPTLAPSRQPTSYPTPVPSQNPTPQPSMVPTLAPSLQPTSYPTPVPSHQPTPQPSMVPTLVPSQNPTLQPSMMPTPAPSQKLTLQPSIVPTVQPTSAPNQNPSSMILVANIIVYILLAIIAYIGMIRLRHRRRVELSQV